MPLERFVVSFGYVFVMERKATFFFFNFKSTRHELGAGVATLERLVVTAWKSPSLTRWSTV